MINIWGQPLSASEKKPAADSIKDVKKLIEDEIAETLNLASVDPNEIVVFQDRTGKLKTSNVSLDDILTRHRDAADNSIVLFQDGKLTPGALVSTITDKLSLHDKDLDDHIKTYNTFRRNISKFLGTPALFTPSLTEIKTSMDEIVAIKTSLDKIVAIKMPLDKLTDITTSIESQEISINIFKNDLSKVFSQLEKINADLQILKKVNILHPYPKNIVYTIESGTMDWIRDVSNTIFISITARGTNWISGIYRLTLISKYQFNIVINGKTYPDNIATFIFNGVGQLFDLVAVNGTVVRSKITWCLEFITAAEIPTEI